MDGIAIILIFVILWVIISLYFEIPPFDKLFEETTTTTAVTTTKSGTITSTPGTSITPGPTTTQSGTMTTQATTTTTSVPVTTITSTTTSAPTTTRTPTTTPTTTPIPPGIGPVIRSGDRIKLRVGSNYVSCFGLNGNSGPQCELRSAGYIGNTFIIKHALNQYSGDIHPGYVIMLQSEDEKSFIDSGAVNGPTFQRHTCAANDNGISLGTCYGSYYVITPPETEVINRTVLAKGSTNIASTTALTYGSSIVLHAVTSNGVTGVTFSDQGTNPLIGCPNNICKRGPKTDKAVFVIEQADPPPAPTSCPWGAWIPISECSVGCGGGTRTLRRLDCNNVPETKTETCNTQPCCTPVWGEWSACSTSCGPGTRTRTQYIPQSQSGCTQQVNSPLLTETEICTVNSADSVYCTGHDYGQDILNLQI